MSDFWNFRLFITETWVKYLFILMVVITLTTYVVTSIMLFFAAPFLVALANLVLFGPLSSAIILLFARIFCEIVIVLFKIHRELRTANDTRERGSSVM